MDNSKIEITPISGLVTSEDGRQDTFTLKLTDKPNSEVSLNLSSDNTQEGIINKTSLTFTPNNWNKEQTVTVTGVDDSDDDGNIDYQIILEPLQSSDNNFSGFDPEDVQVTNLNNESFTFAALGDYGDGDDERKVAELVKEYLNPHIVITTGDNSYSSEPIDQNIGQFYSDYIGNYQGDKEKYGPGSTVNRFFPSVGNHDYTDAEGLGAYRDYFTLPGEGINSSNTSTDPERYYDFVQGPVHFFVLDSNPNDLDVPNGSEKPFGDGRSPDSIQGVWLKEQMEASSAPWKIVYFHHAPYTSTKNNKGNRSEEAMQWSEFEDWGATAVLAGHAHVYERVLRDANNDGVTLPYFVTGLGGRDVNRTGTPIEGSKVLYNPGGNTRRNENDDHYGTMLVNATDTSINFKFFSTDPKETEVDPSTGVKGLIDTYTIKNTIDPPSQVLINEVKANPPGRADNKHEYIELSGSPQESLDNFYVVAFDSRGRNTGKADTVVNLNSKQLGSNGLLAVVGENHSYTIPDETTVVNFPKKSRTLQDKANSILLIHSPEAITQRQDYDKNNDGVLELPNGATIIDSIAWDNGGKETVYGQAVVAQPNQPDALSRFLGNTDAQSTEAWYYGELLGDADSVTYDPDNVSENFPPGGVLTPGEINDSQLSVQTLIFDDGTDTFIQEGNPDADNSKKSTLEVDGQDMGGEVQALLRFNDLFGAAPEQIPLNAEIKSASVELDITNKGNKINFHAMLKDWDDTDNWNDFGGDGIQADNTEAAMASVVANPSRKGKLSVDVTESVQAWQQGSNNYGWAILPTGNNGVDFDSFEGDMSPQLLVTFESP